MLKSKSKKGFTLIELIVAISILAVLGLILVPSLIFYIDNSKVAKDENAMSSLIDCVESALATDAGYKEISSQFCMPGKIKTFTYSCYSDGNAETMTESNKIRFNANSELFKYNDNARTLDEVRYNPNGKMYGTTITFFANDDGEFVFSDGKFNQMLPGGTDDATLEKAAKNLLKTIERTFGKSVKISSKTYRHSNYTIFIYSGGAASVVETASDPMDVYGQWNGTNLDAAANAP